MTKTAEMSEDLFIWNRMSASVHYSLCRTLETSVYQRNLNGAGGGGAELNVLKNCSSPLASAIANELISVGCHVASWRCRCCCIGNELCWNGQNRFMNYTIHLLLPYYHICYRYHDQYTFNVIVLSTDVSKKVEYSHKV